MRNSSMKSVVAALSITVTLLAAAPAAAAHRVQGASPRNPQTAARDAGRNEDRLAVVRQFINRAVRRVASNSGLVIPTPPPATNP